MSVEPMLNGAFKPGTWAAIRVRLENDGPAIDGELRLTSSVDGSSTFGRVVQLASGARQEHVIYGRMGAFAGRFTMSLISGSTTLATANVTMQSISAGSPVVLVVAERPQVLVGPLTAALDVPGRPKATVVSVAPEQLPPRAEAWQSADVLVWQDVDSNRLSADQLAALQAWVATGGHMLIAAGSTGTTTLGAFPPGMLPYQPAARVDVPVADIAQLLGATPDGATPLVGWTGALERGTSIATSGSLVIAARATTGAGSVALIGIDPATPWLAQSPAATVLWTKALPSKLSVTDIEQMQDESSLINSLNNLPAIQLPSLGLLLVVLVGYILAIGPINYFVLRRRDRRELAWITMPATILVFAIGAYLLGTSLRGSSIVVNELAIVRGAAGSDVGLAQVYVGVFAPSRSSFDVRVGGSSLVSAPAFNPASDPFTGTATEVPIDVLEGDPALLRGFGVGFGSLRPFRAQTLMATPRVDADLTLTGDRVEGTIVNMSAKGLEDVSVVYGTAVQKVGNMAPGESRAISFAQRTSNEFDFNDQVTEALYPSFMSADGESARKIAARRAILQHLSGGWSMFTGQAGPSAFAAGPVVLAWESGTTIDVQLGAPTEQVGERVYFLPAHLSVSGPVSFVGGSLQSTVLDVDVIDGYAGDGIFSMSRGTVAVEYQPVAFDGKLDTSLLTFRLSQSGSPSPAKTGDPAVFLPDGDQPDTDNPLAADPRPGASPGTPRVQLFDRIAAAWMELEPVEYGQTYVVAQPERFVDAAGGFRIRFVVRDPSDYLEFWFAARVEGNVE
jgi:hypothetical protein